MRGRSREETYDLDLLRQSDDRWRLSAGLRAVYGGLYRAMAEQARLGPALEIGSGIGAIKRSLPDVVTSDVRETTFADRVVSAYDIESDAGGPWQTIYAMDVLHHLRDPFRFFESASRVLAPQGRIVMCEPAATGLGRRFYGAFHHEPIDLTVIPCPYAPPPTEEGVDFANMAMAWALFVRDRASTQERLEALNLTVCAVAFRDVIAYPATGGFSGPTLLPAMGVRAVLALESLLPQWLLRRVALRMIVTLERR